MKQYHVIGQMSGTSCDANDLVYSVFTREKEWNFEIIYSESYNYNVEWQKKLLNLQNVRAEELLLLNNDYSVLISTFINDFIKKYNIKKIDFISLHGHTVFHLPQKKMNFQLCNGHIVSTLVNKVVICDFRSKDISLNGEGAPLVAIGDKLLFKDFFACINIGGIANISFFENNKFIAYDICPANILLNELARKKNLKYDKDGDLARSGNININLLNELNNIDYYKRKYPKSLSFEYISKHFLSIIENYNISIEDKLATLTEHISEKILMSIKFKNKKILFSGGGVHNKYLISKIKSKSLAEVIIPHKTLIDYKEALIFAFLGVLRYRGETNVLSSVTGAKRNSCSGVIYLP